ncbi:MAG TPA: alcohol dehydrogenase catalytic domain-containing protein [Mycobacteriales bacterium]|nr:alcohol dehydrogenase catalytic domain-containing protein [Mycobacteriales bacterium]
MRTVMIDGVRSVTVTAVPDAVLPGPDGAVVQVEATAICGSDLHFYDGDLPFYPMAVGHEAIGTVIEVGPDVRRFAPGDRVLVASVTGCGACDGCATGDPVTCVQGPKVFGAGELGGAQAELLAVHAADFQLLHVPEGLSDEAALLLTDNLATGWAGAAGARGTVVVLGLGAVGLCAYRSAEAQGADVIGFDPVAGRRARVARSVEGTVVDAVLEATGGRGADMVIDCVANDVSMNDAFASVRSGGTVSVVGLHSMEPYPLSLMMGVYRSITLRMRTAPVHQTWPDLVPLVQSGALDTTGIVTHSFPLDDAAAAYATVAARSADCMKVVLVP